ncbi:type II secretion system protein [Roseimicrobium sp. ORNL1]|uniref:type II secretion system protein n=1 Tax=Roseimicrobium sp. ORNL1 TaxID=2711231 RepID=UPI0013E1533B|nr:type II secretion system protein [Roseimicrobium sp. ORNL1]QIF05420.1 type II secretion system protein [Roseimicrobium sp. ORNL1]
MKQISLNNASAQGFSFVEILAVLGVIGVIAAIAIPQLGGINSGTKEEKNQRNAQSIVSVYAAASAAGATISGTDVDTIVADITDADGVKVDDGVFKDKRFSVSGLSPHDIAAAQAYIKYDETSGGLVYTKNKAS